MIPLGARNNQKNLEIIINIQAAIHKNFSIWWQVGFQKWPFLPVFSQFGGFGRSCPFCTLPRVPLGTTNSQKSLEIIIYIQTASHKNFSMWWRAISCIEKFLCVFVRFCPSCAFCAFLPALYTSSATTGDNKQPEKSGNYNIYSNG